MALSSRGSSQGSARPPATASWRCTTAAGVSVALDYGTRAGGETLLRLRGGTGLWETRRGVLGRIVRQRVRGGETHKGHGCGHRDDGGEKRKQGTLQKQEERSVLLLVTNPDCKYNRREREKGITDDYASFLSVAPAAPATALACADAEEPLRPTL